jgi:hypothetical protein
VERHLFSREIKPKERHSVFSFPLSQVIKH